MNIVKILVAVSIVAGFGFSANAQSNRQTYRDAMGRNQGTATTDNYGKTTFRDAMGRTQGTSTTDRYGKTTYRDAMGRVIGTKK